MLIHHMDSEWITRQNGPMPGNRQSMGKWVIIFPALKVNSLCMFYVNDASGSGQYWYPLHKWANTTVKSYTETYCLDGAVNRMDWDYCNQPNRRLYYPVLKSNDPVNIPGSFEARKLLLY